MRNLSGINIYHKIHGVNYEKIQFIHTANQKIKTHFIFFYTTPQEPMIIYTDGLTKNTEISKIKIL